MATYDGLVPFMNQRKPGAALLQDNPFPPNDPGARRFALGGNIEFTWLESREPDPNNPGGFRNFVENSFEHNYGNFLNIDAHSRWGTTSSQEQHDSIAAFYTVLPAVITYPSLVNRTALNAITGVEFETAFVISDNTYWTWKGRWVRYVQKVLIGTTTVFSDTYQIYRIIVPQNDIPIIRAGIKAGEYYDLCWFNNNRHAKQFDATFNILPGGYRIYDEIPDRTELNTRVAGEKALYEDEFLTAGQIEGSANVTLRWRNLDGSLTGYSTDAAKGGNLVIEATGGGGGTSNVEGRTYGPFHTSPAATIYYDETTATIRFQDEPLWYTDAMVSIADTKLPIQFDLIGDPLANPTTSIIRARAVNNNLHCSVTPLSGINYYPMALANAPVLDDYTVNHIRFVDTQSVTWDVKGDVMPTLMPDGSTAVRQGIILKALLNGQYSNWNIRSGNFLYYSSANAEIQSISNDIDNPLPSTKISVFSVDSLDTVDFWGKNGVVCTLVGASSNRLQILVDRPLEIDAPATVTFGPSQKNITYIRFDSLVSTAISPTGAYIESDGRDDPHVHISYAGFGQGSQILPAITNTLVAYDGVGYSQPSGRYGTEATKTVRSFRPRSTGRYASSWACDYNLNDIYRTLAGNYPVIEIPFWGWDDANAESNIICSSTNNSRKYTDSDYGIAKYQNQVIGSPDLKILSLPGEEGLYAIDVTVQGIMGMNPGNQPFNPIISQAVHLHLFARGTGSKWQLGEDLTLRNKVLQSLDVMKNYTVVPYIANQPGQDTHTWYRQANASRPWSMQGSGLFWFSGLEDISAILTLNNGGYNNEFFYQVCYIKMNCTKVSDVADLHTEPKTARQDTQPTTYNYAPQRWHDMIFY